MVKNNKKDLLIPKNDVVFHALFRQENKRLTEALITDILGEKVKIKTADKDRHLNIKEPEQKYGIMDLRIELENGTNCNIEIQIKEYEYEIERFLYYWANTYSRQLNRGERYKTLHKTISIIILDHEIKKLEGEESIDTKWQIRDNKTGKKVLTEQLEIVIIEIPKAIRIYKRDEKNRICQWMKFINNPNEEEVKKIMRENKEIKEAVKELEIVSRSERLRRIAELREKAIRDEQSAMALATERGLEQGMRLGEKNGEHNSKIEIAKNLLKENIDENIISRVTGLSMEEIENLRKNIGRE